jgi:hypothetical protein
LEATARRIKAEPSINDEGIVMSQEPRSLMRPLVDGLKDAKEVAVEIGNRIADAATDSEVLKKVPIVSAVVAVTGFCDAMMSFKLARNTQAFLLAAGKGAAPDALERLYEKVMGDPRFRDDVPDTIVQLLIDSHKPVKAEIVGRLFAAVAAKRLSVEDFNTLCLLVLSASVPALHALDSLCTGLGNFTMYDASTHPGPARLVEEEPLLHGLGVLSRDRIGLHVSVLGQKLYVFGFENEFLETFPAWGTIYSAGIG